METITPFSLNLSQPHGTAFGQSYTLSNAYGLINWPARDGDSHVPITGEHN